ncbi:hypothetical protein J6590_054131 [Homalodisca vitripennis]|nr:hypothetical protein J6590_054131 [Homalodisca vitripennis]
MFPKARQQNQDEPSLSPIPVAQKMVEACEITAFTQSLVLSLYLSLFHSLSYLVPTYRPKSFSPRVTGTMSSSVGTKTDGRGSEIFSPNFNPDQCMLLNDDNGLKDSNTPLGLGQGIGLRSTLEQFNGTGRKTIRRGSRILFLPEPTGILRSRTNWGHHIPEIQGFRERGSLHRFCSTVKRPEGLNKEVL